MQHGSSARCCPDAAALTLAGSLWAALEELLSEGSRTAAGKQHSCQSSRCQQRSPSVHPFIFAKFIKSSPLHLSWIWCNSCRPVPRLAGALHAPLLGLRWRDRAGLAPASRWSLRSCGRVDHRDVCPLHPASPDAGLFYHPCALKGKKEPRTPLLPGPLAHG